MSEISSNAIYKVLKTHYRTVGIATINSQADLNGLVNKRPDLVFTGMKYLPSGVTRRKIWLSGFLNDNQISHTGSPMNAIKYEQDKPLSKQCVINAGLNSSKYLVIKNGEKSSRINLTLKFPLFVKPTNLGAGAGVDIDSVVWDRAELDAKTKSLAITRSADSLVEEYLPGREFSVGILKDEFCDDYRALPIEMLPGANRNGERIISGELKSAELETPVSAVLDPILKASLCNLAKQCFIALGARDYGRIDIRLDASGIPHFLEANLIPGLIKNSGNFQKACFINLNMTYEEVIMHIVRLGLARQSELLADEEPLIFGPVLAPASI